MPGSCPICAKPKAEQYRPFCSKRCADLDLGKWLNGAYAVPALEVDDPDADDRPSRETGQGDWRRDD